MKNDDSFDLELEKFNSGNLPDSHIFNLGKPGEILQNCGFPAEHRIELAASRLRMKANQGNHPFEILDIQGLAGALQKPVAVFEYGDKSKSQNVIVNLEKDGKNFLVGVFFNQIRDGFEVSSIRGLFNRDNMDWLHWIQQGKMIYGNKEKIQVLAEQQRTNLADVHSKEARTSSDSYYLDSVDNILQSFGDVKDIYTKDFPKYAEQKERFEISKKFRNAYQEVNAINVLNAVQEADEFYDALKSNNKEVIARYTDAFKYPALADTAKSIIEERSFSQKEKSQEIQCAELLMAQGLDSLDSNKILHQTNSLVNKTTPTLVIDSNQAARIKAAREIKENMPNLSENERTAAIAILEAGAKSQGVEFSEYVEKTFPDGIFGDIKKAENAAKQQGVNINGAVSVNGFGENVKAVIYAGKTADFSTWCHELSHIWQAQLAGELKNDAEEAFQVKDSDWQNSIYTFKDGHTDTSAEAFAYGFEDFLKNKAGEMAAENKKKIFEKFADYMSRTYNGVKQHIEINEKIASVYQKFVELDDNILAQAEKAVQMEVSFSDYFDKTNSVFFELDSGDTTDVSDSILEGKPIKEISTKEFNYDGSNLKDFALNYIKNNPVENAKTKIGNIEISETGLRHSLSHTIYKNKLYAIPAIKDTLEKGTYLGVIKDFEGKRQNNYYFAAPITIDNDKNILFIRVKHVAGRDKALYIHDIFTLDEIKKVTPYSGEPNATRRSLRGATLAKSIIQDYEKNNNPIINSNQISSFSKELFEKIKNKQELTFSESQKLYPNIVDLSEEFGNQAPSEKEVLEKLRSMVGEIYATSTDGKTLRIPQGRDKLSHIFKGDNYKRDFRKKRELNRKLAYNAEKIIGNAVFTEAELAKPEKNKDYLLGMHNYEVPVFVNGHGFLVRLEGEVIKKLPTSAPGSIPVQKNTSIESNIDNNELLLKLQATEVSNLYVIRKQKVLFQTAYHGSGANFNKFNISEYGMSGEGSMAFGYGVYVSNSESIAKSYAGRQGERNLYTVEIPDGNYISWEKTVSKTQKENVKNELYKKLIEEDYKGAEKEIFTELNAVFGDELDGKYLYGTVSSYIGSDKETSKFFKDIGFSGIEYPAGTFSGERQNAVNYVIFDDNDIKIKNHFQFQIIGELGARELDRNAESNERIANLETAKRMEEAEKDANVIRLATGWEKGADGKWKYEIDDSKVHFNLYDAMEEWDEMHPRYEELREKFFKTELSEEERKEFDQWVDERNEVSDKHTDMDFSEKLFGKTFRLPELMRHNELFKAYPELKYVTVSIKKTGENGTLGNASYEDKHINLYRHEKDTDGFEEWEKKAGSVLLHEVQHIIQGIEGFAKGASPEMFEESPEASEQSSIGRKIVADGKSFMSAMEAYRASAGEVESRNVQTRMRFTPKQRINTLLSDTADIAPKDQIVMFDVPTSESRDIKNTNEERSVALKADSKENKMGIISATMKSATKDFMDLNATSITEEKSMKNTETFESQEYWKNQFQQENADTFKAIDDYLDKGIRPKGEIFSFFKSPEILKFSEISENTIQFSTKVINKARNTHNLTNEEIKSALINIASPVLIFDSDINSSENKENSVLLIANSMASSNKPLAITLNMNVNAEIGRKEIIINEIRSIHDRTLIAKNGTDLIQKWTENGLCRYVDDKKISEWSKAAGVQFPLAVLQSDKTNILSESNIVNGKKISEWQLAAGEQFPLAVLHSDRNNILSESDFVNDKKISNLVKEREDSFLLPLAKLDKHNVTLTSEIVNGTDYPEIRTFSKFAEQQKDMEKEYQEYLGTISPDEESSRRIDSGEIFGKLENQQSKEELNVATYKFQSGETLDEIIQGNSDFSTETALLDNLIDSSIREVYEYATDEEKTVLRQFAAFRNDYDTDMKNLTVQTDCISRWIAAEHWNPEKQEFQKEYVNQSAIKDFPYKLPWEMKEIEDKALQSRKDYIPELKTHSELKAEKIKNLEIITQEEFDKIVDALYQDGKPDYKNIPEIIRLPKLNDELAAKLNIDNENFFLKTNIAHSRPQRKGGYAQSLRKEEMKGMLDFISSCKNAYIDTDEQHKNFFIAGLDEKDNAKANKIVFNKDELGNYIVTIGKIDVVNLQEKNYTKVAVGVEPTIWSVHEERSPATMLRPSTTLATEENISQVAEKSINEQKIKMPDQLVYAAAKVGQVIEQRTLEAQSIVNPTRADRLSTISIPLNKDYNEDFSLSTEKNMSATQKSINEEKTKLQIIEQEDKEQLAAIVMTARKTIKESLAQKAEPLVEVDFSKANYDRLFPFGIVQTPLEKVKLGENQFEKLDAKDRKRFLLATFQTLATPDLVIDEEREGKHSHNYIKSFVFDEKTKTIQDVVVNINGENVSITAHPRDINNIVNKIKMPDQLVYAAAKVGQVIEQRVQNELGIVNPTRDDRLSTISVPLNKEYNENFALSTVEKLLETEKNAQKATAPDFQQIEPALQKKFDKLKAAIKSREEQDIQDISAAEETGNKKKAIRSKSDIIRQAGKDFLKSVKEGIAPFFNAEDDFQRIIMHPQAIINASNGLPFSGESQLLAQIYHQRQRMEGEVVTSIAGAKAAGTIVLDTPESRQKNFALTDTSSLAEKNAIVRTRYFMPESCEEPDKIYAHTLQRQRPDKIRSYRDLIRHFENIPNGQKEISDIRIRIAHEHLKEIQSRFAIKEKRVLSVDEIEERKNFLRNYFERLPADYRNSERSAFEDTFGIQLNSEKNLEINLQRDFKDIDFAELKKNTKKSIELENRKLSDFIEKNTMEDKKLATLLSDEYKSLSKEEKMTVRNLKIEAIGIKEPETFLGKYLAACNTNAEFITDKETVEEVKKNLVKKLEENFKLEKYDILKEIGQQAQSIGNETTKKISFEKAHSNNKSLEKTQSPDKEISLIGMGK